VQGRSHLNRAIDGDIVVVEMLPDDQWLSPSEIVLQDEENADADDVAEDEKVLGNSSKTQEKIPTGKIVGIIRRKWRQYCGILQPSAIKGVRKFFVLRYNSLFISIVLYNLLIVECKTFVYPGREKNSKNKN